MILPQEDLERFVRRHFENRDRYLRLAAREGSPLYILESDVLTGRAGRFRRVFLGEFDDCRFYFAMKSNNHPGVAGTLLKAGFGLDVSSGKELALALSLGAEDILFTGPGKTGGELILAVENAERVTLVIDSFRELAACEALAAVKGVTIRAGVRLCPNPTGLWRKFGVSLADLPRFFQEAEKCPHVDLQGLQFHTSWNLSPKAQTDFIALLGKELAAYPASLLKKIRFLDVGGGYWPEPGEWLHGGASEGGNGEGGVPGPCPGVETVAKGQSQNDDAGQRGQALSKGPKEPVAAPPPVHVHEPATPIETFAKELRRAVEQHLGFLLPLRICFEPGRWICSDAMHLLMTVVDQKAPDLVITDAGINAIGWERFETDYFPVLNLTRPSLSEKPCSICGSLCTPHDLFGYAYFGEEIRSGDVLMIPCQGAYTWSLRQEFIKPVPEVAFIEL